MQPLTPVQQKCEFCTKYIHKPSFILFTTQAQEMMNSKIKLKIEVMAATTYQGNFCMKFTNTPVQE